MSFQDGNAQKEITGQVIDDNNIPMPGVTVLIEGTNQGTATDFDGFYSLEASPSDVLVFSFIGYDAQKVTVGEKTTIDLVLQANAEAMDEIVVIGYGTAKRSDLTGSISSVKAEELDKIKPVSFEGGLASRAAGVQVTQSEGGPGAGFQVRVRGGSSINASNDPLYVIDGFAIPGSPVSTSTGIGNSTTSPLSTIDPSTIESIEILKDASATAIYGSRGANGVVLITTKGGKKGRTDLNFEAYTSVSNIVRPIDLLSAQEFVDWRYEYTPFDPNNPTGQFVGAYRDQFGNPIDLNNPDVILTDWQDEIARTAITSNYKLSLSGGSENTSYAGSFSYLDQEGVIKTSNFERYAASIKVDQKISDKWKAGLNVNIGYNKRSGVVSAATENANGRSGIVTNAVLFSPVQGLTRYDDAEYDDDGRLLSLRGGDIVNPNRILEGNLNEGDNFQSFGNIFVQYNFTDALSFKSSIRGNFYTNKGQAYYSEKFGWGQSANGRAFTNESRGAGFITEQNLSFNKTFDDHRINATAVYEQQQNFNEFLVARSTGFNLPGVNLDNLGTATVTLPTNSGYNDNSLKSYLGRVQYDFKNRYTLNLSARYDGSSRFAEDKKWGFFPSAGVAWKVSNEKFLENSKTFNNLKLSASYGETGNTQIGSYRSIAAGTLANYIFAGDQLATGVAIDRLGNPDLTWETTTQYDIGLSLGLFKNRITLDADYYNKSTTDLLLEVPLPTTSGFEFSFSNLGEVENKGLEFALNTINIEKDNFTWNSSFNISFNKNEIKNLGGANEFFVTAIGDNQIQNDYIVRVGESLGSIYGIEEQGVYNYGDFAAFDGLTDTQAAEQIRQDAATQGIPYYDLVYTLKDGVVTSAGQPDNTQYRPGIPKFVDQNGDGIVNSDDRTIIGNTLPEFFGGFNNNFTYKNFDLSVLTSFSYGNDVYNKNIKQGTSQDIPFFNKYGQVRDRWTPENPNTNVPGIWGYGDAGISGNTYSSYVEDGSYIRLSNITFGYNLPNDTANKMGLKSFRVYGAVDNLYIWTDYSGYDPDVSVGNNQLTPGLDVDSYPRARTFRIGMNIGL
ncbi:SusC/RagA family TonB-linked outer membrane protein [Christiangramia forsetii]|nr:SusC/RagA family TonB-linked outer membrane protein [Christiangramia forsetii]